MTDQTTTPTPALDIAALRKLLCPHCKGYGCTVELSPSPSISKHETYCRHCVDHIGWASLDEAIASDDLAALLDALETAQAENAALREWIDNAWRGIETDLELLNPSTPRNVHNEATGLAHLAALAREARALAGSPQ